jgi:hypothetical protein
MVAHSYILGTQEVACSCHSSYTGSVNRGVIIQATTGKKKKGRKEGKKEGRREGGRERGRKEERKKERPYLKNS